MFAAENAFDREIFRAIARWGPFYGVTIPVWLVKSIIARESGFRLSPGTSSEPGGRTSYGLMRVLDSTAMGFGAASLVALLIPAIGIDYGVRYLGQQLKRYGGNVERAVAAYNAGTAKVASSGRWLNQAYVDAVAKFSRYFRTVQGVALPAAAILAIAGAVWVVRSRRPRAA